MNRFAPGCCGCPRSAVSVCCLDRLTPWPRLYATPTKYCAASGVLLGRTFELPFQYTAYGASSTPNTPYGTYWTYSGPTGWRWECGTELFVTVACGVSLGKVSNGDIIFSNAAPGTALFRVDAGPVTAFDNFYQRHFVSVLPPSLSYPWYQLPCDFTAHEFHDYFIGYPCCLVDDPDPSASILITR